MAPKLGTVTRLFGCPLCMILTTAEGHVDIGPLRRAQHIVDFSIDLPGTSAG
jgi:hypothetical protein